MEIIHQEPIDLEQVADLCAVEIKRRLPVPRNYQAWHVTNLIDSAKLVSQGSNQYHEYQGRPLGIMSLGRIWETAIDSYLTDWATRKGGVYIPDMEQQQDGIIASLDGVMMLPDYGWLVSETKLRFTLNDSIPLRHLQQVRAYCHLVQTDLVCYVSGHLSSTPPTARANLKIIRLTEQSIGETWEMLVNTKKYLEGCGITPVSNSAVEA